MIEMKAAQRKFKRLSNNHNCQETATTDIRTRVTATSQIHDNRYIQLEYARTPNSTCSVNIKTVQTKT